MLSVFPACKHCNFASRIFYSDEINRQNCWFCLHAKKLKAPSAERFSELHFCIFGFIDTTRVIIQFYSFYCVTVCYIIYRLYLYMIRIYIRSTLHKYLYSICLYILVCVHSSYIHYIIQTIHTICTICPHIFYLTYSCVDQAHKHILSTCFDAWTKLNISVWLLIKREYGYYMCIWRDPSVHIFIWDMCACVRACIQEYVYVDCFTTSVARSHFKIDCSWTSNYTVYTYKVKRRQALCFWKVTHSSDWSFCRSLSVRVLYT